MMPRFFMNLYNDVECQDEEGSEFDDLPAAKAAAIVNARHLMADHLVADRPINLADRIEVADESGCVLAVIPFRELLTIIDR